MTITKRPHLGHVRELDGIRGIAAIAVFFHHIFFTSIVSPEQWNWLVLAMSRLSELGARGVDLFFVLSGFLITSILLGDRSDPSYFWNFYWKRALRILPLYAITLLCVGLFLPGTARYVLISALFIANFAQVFHIAANGPFWTLAIEEQFYLIWPQFVRRLTVDGLERLAVAIIIAETVLRLVAALFGHYDYWFTFFHCDGLALGALLACRQARLQSSEEENKSAKKKNMHLLIAFAAGVALMLLPSVLPGSGRLMMAGQALNLTGVNLVCYAVVAFAVTNSGVPILALLRSRLLVFFGLISYCMYMSHDYVLNAYDHWYGPLQTGNMTQYFTRFAVVLVVTVAICLVSRYV